MKGQIFIYFFFFVSAELGYKEVKRQKHVQKHVLAGSASARYVYVSIRRFPRALAPMLLDRIPLDARASRCATTDRSPHGRGPGGSGAACGSAHPAAAHRPAARAAAALCPRVGGRERLLRQRTHGHTGTSTTSFQAALRMFEGAPFQIPNR